MNTSQNYKGVPGGNPAMRTKHSKPPVAKVTFICSECNTKVTEPERRKTPGVCAKCVTVKNLTHQRAIEKAREDASKKRQAQKHRNVMATPLRSNEALQSILDEYKNWSKEECEFCENKYFVDNGDFPLRMDNPDRPNAIKTVIYTSDPFRAEINDDHTEYWMCASCISLSNDEI